MSENKLNLSQIVANDDGSSANKVAYWGIEDGGLVVKTDLYKTAIHEGGANLASMGLEDGGTYGVNGQTFTIDETMDGIDVRSSKDYQYSNGAVAMNQYSLQRSGFSGKKVFLANGLPVEDFYRGTSDLPNDEYKQKKASAFLNAAILNAVDSLGSPSATDPESLVDVIGCSVYPEGAAAYYDMIISNNGDRNDDRFAGDIVIIDMGSYTTDICLIGRGGKVRTEYVKTLKDCGFLKIFDNFKKGCVSSGLSIQTNQIPRERMEEALLTKKLRTIRTDLDVSSIVDSVILSATAEITRGIELLLGDRLDYVTDIIAIGGGANYIKDHFPKFSDVIQVPENPQFSTATGYLKLATYFSSADITNDLI